MKNKYDKMYLKYIYFLLSILQTYLQFTVELLVFGTGIFQVWWIGIKWNWAKVKLLQLLLLNILHLLFKDQTILYKSDIKTHFGRNVKKCALCTSNYPSLEKYVSKYVNRFKQYLVWNKSILNILLFTLSLEESARAAPLITNMAGCRHDNLTNRKKSTSACVIGERFCLQWYYYLFRSLSCYSRII